MAVDHQVGDSTPKVNSRNEENWKSVGDLARQLVLEQAQRLAAKDAAE